MKRGLVCVLVLAAAMPALAACSSDSPPQPASSVAFVAGRTFADSSADVTQGRVVIAYVSAKASADQVRRLGQRIAALPEVRRYAYMTKDDCLGLLSKRFGQDPHQSPRPIWPLPQGYWMLLDDADQAPGVQQALTDDPALNRDESPFSGVRPARQLYRYFMQ